MGLKHKIVINVSDPKGKKTTVLRGADMAMPGRLLRFLFGDFTEVLVITPGKTVDGIEVKEMKDGDDKHAER